MRALSLCLFTAALLAVYILDAKLRAVYTMAEHSERVVEVDLRPVLYVRSLRDSRSSAKRSFLAELASAGEAELGRYEKCLGNSPNTACPTGPPSPAPPFPKYSRCGRPGVHNRRLVDEGQGFPGSYPPPRHRSATHRAAAWFATLP
ncbi:MAG: hypothetical protein ACP5MH_11390 [Thermoproteus sp.]